MPDDGHFDATIAATYDDPRDPMNQPAAIDPAVDFLASLAGDGRALEFAIGTGRIGLPLRRRGVEVHGIELSRAMLDHLRRKEGGDDPGHRRRHDHRAGRRALPARLPRLQHDHERDHAGRPGGGLPQCGHAPRTGWRVRHRGRGARPAALPFGETFGSDFSERHFGIDEYDVVNQGLVSHHFDVRGDAIAALVGAVPLRLALGPT